MPLASGSTTPRAKLTATAASITLPPRRMTSRPASVDTGCALDTPARPVASARSGGRACCVSYSTCCSTLSFAAARARGRCVARTASHCARRAVASALLKYVRASRSHSRSNAAALRTARSSGNEVNAATRPASGAAGASTRIIASPFEVLAVAPRNRSTALRSRPRSGSPLYPTTTSAYSAIVMNRPSADQSTSPCVFVTSALNEPSVATAYTPLRVDTASRPSGDQSSDSTVASLLAVVLAVVLPAAAAPPSTARTITRRPASFCTTSAMRMPSGDSRGARSVCSVLDRRRSVPSALRIHTRVAPPLPRTKATRASGPTLGDVSCAALLVSRMITPACTLPVPVVFTGICHRS